ncbi:Flp pilus assembly protein CpaB [Pseudomonas sp. R5(2019)]|uniref:Flp pilus assembly protein CpaB n=1 Tax=Pseudomonas sp. R5(2019) TaxID=2697566 RepID=UPI001412175F|nr:Flp pilus assembly protein CpaB [Pseudomonas sp. R5(2019)]NBA95079.1 Flp pilus assembly protein CpaB [Pseudomonas sp. R5(2019)]
MSSRLTMLLAGVFLFGAIIAGYWGFALSRQQPQQPSVAVITPTAEPVAQVAAKAADELRTPVVIVKRDIPAHTVLSADDVMVEQLTVAPSGSFQTPQQVLGRSAWRALPAGTWLDESSFSVGGPLARMIRPGERAVALAVDEVVGAAGQVQPGDYVDVLLFLRQDASHPEPTTQVAIPALRLLSVGEELGLANDGKPAQALSEDERKARQEQRRNPARTMVLAVPEGLASRLLLAAQAGTLRLAVRSADEQRLARYWAGREDSAATLASANRELYRFNQLAMASPAKAPVASAASPVRRGIEIIRGNAGQPTP